MKKVPAIMRILIFGLALFICYQTQSQLSFAAPNLNTYATAANIEIIADNDDGEPSYVEIGSWTLSASTGYNGGTYTYSNASTNNYSAIWKTYIGEGNCEVSVFYRSGANRSTAVKYIVQTTDASYIVFVNQTQNNLQWVTLGTYPCKEGNISVTLDAEGTTAAGVVIADAVRFTGAAPLNPPTPSPTPTPTMPPTPTPIPSKSVYVILASDTSVWSAIDGEGFDYATNFNFDIFTNPDKVYGDVFDDNFRNTHTDSGGNPFKVTWYMHCGGWFTPGLNSNAVSTVFKIRKYWQNELDKWQDEIGLHFHHLEWNGTAWVQADTFGETIPDYEYAVSELVIDESTYPVSFRSGWNYMDNEYQNYLEKWLPFRMEEGGWRPQCIPYHPNPANYKIPGNMKGWEARHIYMKSFTTAYASNIFLNANNGQAQVVCVWSHQNESDYVSQIDFVNASLHAASAAYPDVKFYYCTGKEAMNRWLVSNDATPPELNVKSTADSSTMNVTINADSEIYQLQPWIAARDYSDKYTRLDTAQTSATQWIFSYNKNFYDNITAAVCDNYGNVKFAEIRDGSKRLSNQSEFYRCETKNIDVETSVSGCILSPNTAPNLYGAQGLSSNETQILKRSYWIGQKFIPKSAGISKIVFGANISTPAVYRVELRKIGPEGYPINNADGLLAYETINADSGTTFTAQNINYDGLILDGRPYAVIFKLESGTANVKFNLNNPYAEGCVVRSYSLEWIDVKEFDCVFQIYDKNNQLSINQNTINSGSPANTNGYFISQSFKSLRNIAGIELDIKSGAGDTLGFQLRPLLPDGTPDYNYESIIQKSDIKSGAAGKIYFPLNWKVPGNMLNKDFAISFVSPATGASSIKLGYDTTNQFKDGKMFLCNNLTDFTSPEGNDLYFKLYTLDYCSSGTLAYEFDAQKPVLWKNIKINAVLPEQTDILTRYRIADSISDLHNTSWGNYKQGTEIKMETGLFSKYIQAEFLLISADGKNTPVLNDFEIFYDMDTSSGVSSVFLY